MTDNQPTPELIPRADYPPLRELWVAYSGGLDSTVLLHALAGAGIHRPRALHVHHGLQAAADDWAVHCARVCAELGVDLQVCRVAVTDAGQGLEAAARAARYEALRSYMREGDVLATAHHQDDQAETVLLRLLRGSGPEGLAAMRGLSAFTPGWLWRPLLALPRAQLQAYARTQGLRWIEDPHNADLRFARSALRREILPRLHSHWPAASRNLARTAALSAESAELLREIAAGDLALLVQSPGSLSIAALQRLSPARRRNVLRAWIETLQLPTPYRDTLLRLDTEVLAAAADSDPVLAWPGAEFRRYRDGLYAMRALPEPPADFRAAWDGRAPLLLPPGCGRLAASRALDAVVTVRLVGPGERFRPQGSARTRSLKNIFQERGVPTWVRPRTPVIADDLAVRWIGGVGWAGGAALSGIRIDWLDRPLGAPGD